MKQVPFAVLGMASLFGLNACFAGYDSRWGEAKRIQQHAAVAATPATIHEAPAESADHSSSEASAREYRVRVYATPAYAAQTFDWQRRLAEMFDDADGVLAPGVGIRLTIESFHEWSADEQDLTRALGALRETDDGREVDGVLGLVGSLPRLTTSFHELGMAEVKGKHLVVRAANSAKERDDIERAFSELTSEARSKLARARARHRAAAVLLHEIGHTLGASHVDDAQSFMNPQYDRRMQAFDDATLAQLRATIARGIDARPDEAAPARAEARDAPEVRLPADIASLPEDARARYVEASRALDSGDAPAALEKARPLFDAERDVFSVQDLRCKIALARSSRLSDSRAECARVMELSVPRKN